MELSPRKRAILSEIIRSYISTGEPVGSKYLSGRLDFNVSSATLRNDMSELSELGLLEQPHTSAGRIPTNRGYRVFVNDLMERRPVSNEIKTSIDAMLSKAAGDPEHLMSVAGILLSDLTGLPAIISSAANDEAYIRRAELIPMGRRMVMIVLIASDGTAKSRVCRISADLTPQMLSRFDRVLSANAVGSQISEFTATMLRKMIADAGDFAVAVTPVVGAVFEMTEEMHTKRLSVKGESNILSCYRSREEAQSMLDAISQSSRLLEVIENMNMPIGVIFGDSTGIDELKPSNMIIAKYGSSVSGGRIGVLGPTRMAYEQVIPGLGYLAARLSEIIADSLTDMEE